jgi:hypothetical protein
LSECGRGERALRGVARGGHLHETDVASGRDGVNRAAVRVVAADELDLVGIGVHGPKNAADKIVKGARWHL